MKTKHVLALFYLLWSALVLLLIIIVIRTIWLGPSLKGLQLFSSFGILLLVVYWIIEALKSIVKE